ncbi:MAG: hypothetical protein QOE45_2385 [Frankiaceae bacterium]|jgi:hypothetical protein|nr:hypothetical protein [Frankiaceae bacterium]
MVSLKAVSTESLRNAVIADGDEDPEFLDPAKLDAAAKWTAGGFTLLTAVLTFFGIKEGVLDRLLRSPSAAGAVFVFSLIGLGVVCSLLGPAFRVNKHARVRWLIGAVAVIGALTWWYVHPAGGRSLRPVVVGAVLVVLTARLLWQARLSLVAVVVLLGVAATSFGLYGAANLSVQAKTFPDEPRLVASLETADGHEVVKVVAKVAKFEDRRLLVTVIGRHAESGTPSGPVIKDIGVVLGRSILTPDGVGDIDATVSVPVVSTQWATLSAGYCALGTGAETCLPIDVVTFRGRPDEGTPHVGAAIAPGTAAGTLHATVGAFGVPASTTIAVRLNRIRAGATVTLAFATIAPGKDGTATWAADVTATKPNDVFTVTYVACAPDCTGTAAEIARYVAAP